MLLSTLLSLSLAATTSDTLVVKTAQMEGPYTLYTPFVTDSLNMKGQAIDPNEALNKNATLIEATHVAATPIEQGFHFTVGADSLSTLRVVRFNVQAAHYTKARVEVNGLSHYKLYVDGKECGDKQLKLAPGRAELALLLLSNKESKDSFDVRVIGDKLTDVQVNATGKRPFTIGQQTWGDHYRSVGLSPSGKYLVTISYYTKKDGKAQYTTTLTEVATGRELLHRNEYVSLDWLSNRDVLYYTRQSGTGKELVLFTPANGKEKVIAEHLPDGGFSLSPKEDYIIFNRNEEGKPSKDGLKRIEEPDDRMPGWRNRNSLWRYDLKTGLMQRLTFGSASVSMADISADGKYLLLQYQRSDVSKLPMYRTTFVRMNAYTGEAETLMADTTFINSARFSPSGQQLLISASPAAFAGIGSEVKEGQIPQGFDYRLYLYDIASKKTTPALRQFTPSVADFMWNAGDGQIYFTADNRMGRSFFRLNPKTLQVVKYELPVTYVQDFSLATNAKSAPRLVFFGQTPQRARDMYTCELNKTKPTTRRIGSINFDEIYKDVAIAPSTSWQFKATRGDSIDGFYLLPPNFDSSKKYPMIVYYYGGCSPSSNLLESWYPFQTFASQGYVVYVLNPSGTTAYGQEFAARHVNTWGKESGDDIIQGVKEFCKAHSFVDSKHIGCIGASYGGFMTEYLQTQTDIFAAAISHAGISNITSYWGGGYWGYSYGETAQYGSFPWNNPALYVKQSPLFNADKIHTPLLLLHGTADTNVPTNESQQLYNALKILGRDVTYVQVEGENHVITDYNKRLAWLNVIYAWFAKYLQGNDAWWKALDL